MSYDVVIVGCGIAGLTCGIALAKQKKKVCILEKYGYVGGRVVTYRKDGHQWENGAGRISEKHKRVHSLLKHYGLHTVPIGTDQLYIPRGGDESDAVSNGFEQQFAAILREVRQLPAPLLATQTLEQIVKSIMGEAKAIEFFHQFAYRAEVSVMRADVAMKSFEGEMGSYEGYSVCVEGLSALTDAMAAEFKKLGGEICLRHEMLSVSQKGTTVTVKCRVGSKKEGFSESEISGEKCILALHSSALKQCESTRHFPALRHLVMCPLLRTYAVFPVRDGKAWFSDLPRVVTGHLTRYFIPVDPKHGVVMISYTDADDASRLIKILDTKGEKALGSMILRDVRSMFPNHHIPDYSFFKTHPWTFGCTYWTPGEYDVEKMSVQAMHPDPKSFPSVYVCGESFSTRQAWMEGAIEHAEALLKRYF